MNYIGNGGLFVVCGQIGPWPSMANFWGTRRFGGELTKLFWNGGSMIQPNQQNNEKRRIFHADLGVTGDCSLEQHVISSISQIEIACKVEVSALSCLMSNPSTRSD